LALGVATDRKWANGLTLTVCFFNGTATLRQNVQNHVNQWMQFANIRFRFVPGTSADIRITFTGNGGPSRSFVGTANTTVDALAIRENLSCQPRAACTQITNNVNNRDNDMQAESKFLRYPTNGNLPLIYCTNASRYPIVKVTTLLKYSKTRTSPEALYDQIKEEHSVEMSQQKSSYTNTL
jgi:hypothetical protein